MNIYIEMYKNHIIQNRDICDKTISYYISDLNNFKSFLEINKYGTFCFLQNFHIINYIEYLKGNNKSISTINRKIISIRNFLKFLYIKGIIEENPMFNIDLKITNNIKDKMLDFEQIRILLNSPDTNRFIGMRDKAIFELLLTGIDIGKLVNININQINFNLGVITIIKDNVTDTIHLEKETQKILKNYIEKDRAILAKNTNDNHLFLNKRGTKISRQGAWKVVLNYADKCGVVLINQKMLNKSLKAYRLNLE